MRRELCNGTDSTPAKTQNDNADDALNDSYLPPAVAAAMQHRAEMMNDTKRLTPEQETDRQAYELGLYQQKSYFPKSY